MSDPTSTREAVFDYIVQFKRGHNGIAPTVREITEGVGISTTSLTNYHLGKLFDDGRITFPLGKRAGRAIGVPGFEFAKVTGGAS